MNFKKKVSGSWTDTPYYIHNTSTDTITTLPADIYADGNNATVGLKGNTTQSGTPIPDSPIMPQGTGERTGNLFDENYPNISGTIRYIPLYVGEGSFTLSTTTPYDSSVANVFLLSGNVSTGASTHGNGAWLNHNATTQSVDGYVTIAYRHYSGTISPANCQTMLNTGSTALPYEPYGIKIPISSASTITPVYLGEVQTTRKIKKLVLTGEESYFRDKERADSWRFYSNAVVSGKYNVSICSHFAYIGTSGVNDTDDIGFSLFSASQFGCRCPKSLANTVNGFKAWLAQQYAAGTPVTVWYVLVNEETAIVNEPLMRIGDYADTVSNVSIPVTAGGDTISVGTTVQPSGVTVNYKGWHPITDVHEAENGAWD